MKLPAKHLVLLFLVSTAFAEALLPTRRVEQNALTSESEPNVRIELPKEARYVGADRWVLYNIADCEVHVFVEADEAKRVKRLYCLQFEGYLPSKPKLRYNYSNSERTNWRGMEFLVRARFGRGEGEVTKAGSDVEHVKKLLKAGGYQEAPEMMNVRLVHLLDESTRKELMITYAEDLTSTGASVSDLLPGGAAEARWASLSEGLIQRAKAAIVVTSPSGSVHPEDH